MRKNYRFTNSEHDWLAPLNRFSFHAKRYGAARMAEIMHRKVESVRPEAPMPIAQVTLPGVICQSLRSRSNSSIIAGAAAVATLWIRSRGVSSPTL